MQLLLSIGFLAFVACQGPPKGNPPANPPADPPGNGTNGTQPACDPFLRSCPDSTCDISEVGQLNIKTPGYNSYAYVGIPIKIQWDYSEKTDNVTFPKSSIVFYYRKKEEQEWKNIATVAKGNITNNTYTWTPKEQLLKDTKYNLLALVDDVTFMDTGPGNKPSCFAPGFPVGNFFFSKSGYINEFTVLNPPSGPSDPNNPDKCTKYCPAESSAKSNRLFIYGEFLLYLELLAGLFFLFEL
jgi:hypothetical protein